MIKRTIGYWRKNIPIVVMLYTSIALYRMGLPRGVQVQVQSHIGRIEKRREGLLFTWLMEMNLWYRVVSI
jgi:hypothetical protein